MRTSAITLPLLSSAVCVLADNTRAEAAFNALQDYYNHTTGLWDTCGWWNGANCMTAIYDLAKFDDNIKSEAIDVFATTYKQAPAYNPSGGVTKAIVNGVPQTFYAAQPPKANPVTNSASDSGNAAGFIDTCYDDNGWWALAWMGAYDLTQNAAYLNTAAGIFDNMTGAGPTKCGNGGIVWCSDSSYINAIANELYLSVAGNLASRIPSKQSYYTNIAQNQWTWFQKSGLINSQGLINDGLTDDCKNNGQTTWTYNQGVILGGLVQLYKLNGDTSLLDSASNIAHAAINALTDSNHVLHESCEPNCAPDGTQFKGIFMRNLAMLQQARPDSAFQQVIDNSANSIWANDRRTSDNVFSIDWSGPFDNPPNASTHSSAMEAIVAQALLG